MQDRLYDMLLKRDEITWQSIIYDLIKTEQMDPWDIDISVLSKKYIEAIRKLEEANFLISGKVLLAAAFLLRIKSDKLLLEDLANFDSFLFSKEEEHYEELEEPIDRRDIQIPKLAVKTPLTRKRKVTVNDLIIALNRALKVSERKTLRRLHEKHIDIPEVPEKKIDITILIKNIYEKVLEFFKKKDRVTFSEIVNSDRKEDKILTLIPLLHLDNQEKINMQQQEHFGEIEILK